MRAQECWDEQEKEAAFRSQIKQKKVVQRMVREEIYEHKERNMRDKEGKNIGEKSFGNMSINSELRKQEDKN